MKRIGLVTLSVVLVIMSLLIACTQPASPPVPTPSSTPTAAPVPSPKPSPAPTAAPTVQPSPVAKPIKLTFAFYVADAPLYRIYEPFFAEVTKRTGVQFNVEAYWAGSLVKGDQQLSALGEGIMDTSLLTPGYTPAELPFSTLTNNTPFVPFTSGDLYAAVAGANEFLTTYPPAVNEWPKNKIKFLFNMLTPPYQLLGVKPIKTLADIKGYKARTFGLQSKVWDKLGGVPVTFAHPETYSAMERGTIDGDVGDLETMGALKIHEIAKNFTYVNFGASAVPFCMSLKTWNSLPPAVQKAMDDVAKDTMAKIAATRAQEAADRRIKDYKAAGVTFYTFTPDEYSKELNLGAKPVWDEIANDLNSKGLPGKVAMDTFFNLVSKYEKK